MKRQIRVLCALLLTVAALAACLLIPHASVSHTASLPLIRYTTVSGLRSGLTYNYLAVSERMHSKLLHTVTGGLVEPDLTSGDPGADADEVFSVTLDSEDVGSVSGGDSPVAMLANYVLDACRGEMLAEYAQRFVGYRYVYGSQNPSVGFDCSGLMQYVYRCFGYEINRGATGQLANGRYVKRSELQAGDLVFFGSGSVAFHVGMYIGNGQFVHAANSRKGVIISDLSDSYYNRNYMTARRIIG